MYPVLPSDQREANRAAVLHPTWMITGIETWLSVHRWGQLICYLYRILLSALLISLMTQVSISPYQAAPHSSRVRIHEAIYWSLVLVIINKLLWSIQWPIRFNFMANKQRLSGVIWLVLSKVFQNSSSTNSGVVTVELNSHGHRQKRPWLKNFVLDFNRSTGQLLVQKRLGLVSNFV